MKKTSIKTKVLAGILAAVCTVSAGIAVSSVSVAAATTPTSISSVSSVGSKACVFVAYGKTKTGYDWDYRADSKSAKISCSYDFKSNKYTFRAVGQYAGTTNAVLKYATIDGKWHNVPVRFTTDKKLNVTGVQTGKEYVTPDKYSG